MKSNQLRLINSDVVAKIGTKGMRKIIIFPRFITKEVVKDRLRLEAVRNTHWGIMQLLAEGRYQEQTTEHLSNR